MIDRRESKHLFAILANSIAKASSLKFAKAFRLEKTKGHLDHVEIEID